MNDLDQRHVGKQRPFAQDRLGDLDRVEGEVGDQALADVRPVGEAGCQLAAQAGLDVMQGVAQNIAGEAAFFLGTQIAIVDQELGNRAKDCFAAFQRACRGKLHQIVEIDVFRGDRFYLCRHINPLNPQR